MQAFFDSLPLLALAVLMVGSCTAFALLCAAVAHRFGWSVHHDDIDSATALHALASIVYAVALGLLVVNAQTQHDRVEVAVGAEASRLGDLYRDITALEPAARAPIETLVKRYVDAVIEDEWPASRQGRASELAERAVDALALRVITLRADTAEHAVVHKTLIDDVDVIMDARQTRLLVGKQGMSRATWMVVILGAMVTLGFAGLFPLRPAHRVAIMTLTASIFGLMLFLVISMNLPLRGPVAVTPEAFIDLRATIDRLSQRQ